MLHTARGLALEPGTLLHVGAVPYKGSAPALRLLHTARGLALAWHSAACWGSTLERFCPCPEAATMVANLTCSEDSLWFLSMAADSGYHNSCLALVAHKTENIGLPGPAPFS